MARPPLWARQPGLPTLVRIILEQQVSLASVQAAFERLCLTVSPLTPQGFLTLDDAPLNRAVVARLLWHFYPAEKAAARADRKS